MGGGPLPSDAGRAERMYKVRRAMGHMFFQAATLTGAGTGDAELFHVVCGGDPARTAVWLTSSLSAGAVIEVFLFQIVGRATDHTGRKKPWLFLSPGMSFVTGLAPFLCPRLPVVWASRLLTSSFSALFGGTNMTSAMLSDVVQGDELAQAFSLLVAVMGAGLFIG
jgi:MFS family permease